MGQRLPDHDRSSPQELPLVSSSPHLPSERPASLSNLQRNTHTPREMGQLSSFPCSSWTQLPCPSELM